MRESDIIQTVGEQGEGDILNRQVGKFCLNTRVIDTGPQPFRWGISMSASCRAREPAGRDYQLAGALP